MSLQVKSRKDIESRKIEDGLSCQRFIMGLLQGKVENGLTQKQDEERSTRIGSPILKHTSITRTDFNLISELTRHQLHQFAQVYSDGKVETIDIRDSDRAITHLVCSGIQ
jgi:hypothetical protein